MVPPDYVQVPAIYCSEFKTCLDQLPQGKTVATTVFLKDFKDYPAMNAVYEKRFPGLKPARNTVSTDLPKTMRVGINAIIYTGAETPKGLTPPNTTNNVPITPGILTPGRLFIAGILGRDSNTGTIPSAPKDQIEMCLTRVLATAQLDRSNLVQATLYHTSEIPRELIDTQLKLYFGSSPTIAITILEVPTLALGANIGINGIALFLHSGVTKRDAP